MAKIIDGKRFAEEYIIELKNRVCDFKSRTGRDIGLVTLIVGDNPSSLSYIRKNSASCEKVGIKSTVLQLKESSSEAEVIEAVKGLNEDKAVNGVIIQLPLPKHINKDKVIETLAPEKDVDGLTKINAANLYLGNGEAFYPNTPMGVLALLKSEGIQISGKRAVVIGRSNIVGKPMAMLLLGENATVTVCHSRTENIAEVCRQADILVSAVGRAGFVKADMVKDGAVVMDVGTNFVDGKLVGDVCFEEVKEKASYITPVPGGCGPTTVCMLMENTLRAAENQSK